MHSMRIRGLGKINSQPFPVVETAVGVGGVGLLAGGFALGGKAGTVLGIAGGLATLGGAVMLVLKLAGGPSAPPPPPPAPPPPPPPPPSAPKVPSYTQYAQYAQAALPVINQLFSKLFGVRQPAMLVAVGRGR